MDSNVLLTVLIVASFLMNIILLVLFSRNNKSNTDKKYLNEIFQSVTESSSKQLILLAKQKLESEKSEIKTDLSNKKVMIEDLVKNIAAELDKNNKRMEAFERDRIGSFQSLMTQMKSQQRLTEQLSATAEGLKKVLSNNQLRGQFGEQVAEDLLQMTGFVKGTDYEFNKEQAGSKSRPDFSIFMPDGTKINVDAKFPYNNLQRMTESEDKESKIKYKKAFERDVKDKIKQVTTRDYINPEEQTVDFVILFIPNEMIFSFIYDKMSDIWSEAMKNKVVLAGPFSFTAILRMVRQAYDNFKYQENTQKVIKYIKSFESEFDKYNNEFAKIGVKVDQLSRQYDLVNTTRTKQLMRVIDKIKLEDESSSTSPQKLQLQDQNTI